MRTRMTLLCLLFTFALACGSEAAEEETASSSPDTTEPEATVEAAPEEAPEPEATPPETIGRFGPFRLSYNSIEQDGQCFEAGHEDPNPETLSGLRSLLTRSAESNGAGADAISNDARCPLTDRLPGSCELLHGHIGYYATGSHAYTPETARAHCGENNGTFVE